MSVRSVGVTVLPEFFPNEGVDNVLDNLTRRANVTAIATSPYVMAPMAEGTGSRNRRSMPEPGSVRLLDRELGEGTNCGSARLRASPRTRTSIPACAIGQPSPTA